MNVYVSGDIILKPYKDKFKISEPLDFTVDLKLFTIPKGMITDLGSVPVPFRNIFSRFGVLTVAFIIHDYGYRVQPKNTDRKFWDDVLLELMKKDKIFKVKRFFIYRSLRIFGYKAWNENKEKLKGDLFE